MIDDILEFNKKFVESKGYEKYITNKYPDKKIVCILQPHTFSRTKEFANDFIKI